MAKLQQKSLFINLAKKNSLAPHTATALFSTDLNVTTRGVEKHFSYFSEQISGIIPLHSLPAEVSCSVSLHHVKRDQVFVPTVSNWSPDPPLGLLLECVSQSELSHPWDETNLLFFFLKDSRGSSRSRCGSLVCLLKSVTASQRALETTIRVSKTCGGRQAGAPSSYTVVLTNVGLTVQVGKSFFSWRLWTLAVNLVKQL